ncbi:MAG TPA: hypothetical protein VGQ00_03060 [Candidatus Norongarragalinales archaeon]|jgi:hypothetical protein|nr:hypothetical protein [Candidatus Norongarragalinales archaeon]
MGELIRFPIERARKKSESPLEPLFRKAKLILGREPKSVSEALHAQRIEPKKAKDIFLKHGEYLWHREHPSAKYVDGPFVRHIVALALKDYRRYVRAQK